jgi:hypothetical protein
MRTAVKAEDWLSTFVPFVVRPAGDVDYFAVFHDVGGGTSSASQLDGFFRRTFQGREGGWFLFFLGLADHGLSPWLSSIGRIPELSYSSQ